MSSYLLIPGMSCGAWLWQPVVRQLRESGHAARALTLPGLGFNDSELNPTLTDAVDAIRYAADSLTAGPLTIVAHSGAGVAATGAAFALGSIRVREVVYYAAVVPKRGRSMADEFDAPPADPIPHRLPLSRSDIDIALMPEAIEPVRDLVYGLLTSTPGRYFYDAPEFPSAAELQSATRYLCGTDDLPFAASSQRFAARLGTSVGRVPGSHLGMLTHPREIAAAILGGN